MPTGLYIHIPFCKAKCAYCDFYSIPHLPDREASFLVALLKEIRLRCAGRIFDTMYLGGGTPTTLSPASLSAIFNEVRACSTLAPGAEVTVEANPESVTVEKAALLSELGVTRVSLGVQSLEDEVLTLLSRPHNASQAREAARVLKATIPALGVDLIYGIPGQSVEAWRRGVQEALGLCPEHLSCYELTPEEGTRLYDALKSGVLHLPTEDETAAMYHATVEDLGAAGYEHYEISNYARSGQRSRHNMNYWARGEYLGLGPAAHSFTGDVRAANLRDVGAYVSTMEGAGSAEAESHHVSEAEAMEERIFLALRTSEGLELSVLEQARAEAILRAARPMVEDGLLGIDGSRLWLTDRGMVVYNPVVAALLGA